MDEYINRKELEKRINENIKPETPEEKALIEWCKDECIRQAFAMPRADVVPKSEVEELIRENKSLAKTVNEASELIRKLRSKVEKSKSEVAREIFEEIEAEITAALKSNYEARRAYNPTDEFHMWVQGKIDALGGIEYFIAELKKKYTEDNVNETE